MKKVFGTSVAVVIVVALLSLLGMGFGFGPGGNGDGEGNGEIPSNANSENVVEESQETEDPADGNVSKLTISVSVNESDYFYQNKKISLDALLEELEALEEDFIVEVTDDNASLKAYNALIEALEDSAIDYTEE